MTEAPRPYGYMVITDGPGISPAAPPPPSQPADIAIGLFHRNGTPSNTSTAAAWAGKTIPANYVKGMIVTSPWSDLQPTSSSDVFPSNNAIDQALTTAAGLGIQLKARVQFGSSSTYAGGVEPANSIWFKNLNGTYLTMNEIQDGTTFHIGRTWTAEYIAAFTAFWVQFAATYNSSAVVDVDAAGAMFRYPEPMLRQTKIQDTSTPEGVIREAAAAANRATLNAAGYTLALDIASQQAHIDAMAPLSMSSSFAANPYENGLTGVQSTANSVALMQYQRTKLGAWAVPGNDSLRDPAPVTGGLATIYSELTTLSATGPIYIQTAQPNLVGNLYNACLSAVSYGATYIELPGSTASYTGAAAGTFPDKSMTPAQFDTINAALAANAAALGY